MFFAKIQRHTSQNAISEGDLREQQVKVPCLHGTLRSAAITIKTRKACFYRLNAFWIVTVKVLNSYVTGKVYMQKKETIVC